MQDVLEVLRAVVDDDIRAQAPDQIEVGRARRGGHSGAQVPGQPDEDAGAPGGTQVRGRLPGPLRDLFDGGIWRWVLLGVALLVLLSSFQLIGEQQRGVVLRFGQFDRVMQPGPSLKLPWPIERVIKVNATQIKTFSNVVPSTCSVA